MQTHILKASDTSFLSKRTQQQGYGQHRRSNAYSSNADVHDYYNPPLSIDRYENPTGISNSISSFKKTSGLNLSKESTLRSKDAYLSKNSKLSQHPFGQSISELDLNHPMQRSTSYMQGIHNNSKFSVSGLQNPDSAY